MDILLLKFQSIESNLVGAFIGLRYRRVQEYVTVLIMKGHVCSTLQMFTVAIILNTINEKQWINNDVLPYGVNTVELSTQFHYIIYGSFLPFGKIRRRFCYHETTLRLVKNTPDIAQRWSEADLKANLISLGVTDSFFVFRAGSPFSYNLFNVKSSITQTGVRKVAPASCDKYFWNGCSIIITGKSSYLRFEIQK